MLMNQYSITQEHFSKFDAYLKILEITMNSEADVKLITACDTGDFHLLREAIREGGNVNYASKKGTTPLIVASGKDPELIPVLSYIRYLVQNGANVNERTKNGRSPLSAALFARAIDPDVIAYLLQQGADPDLAEIMMINKAEYKATFMDLIDIHGFPELFAEIFTQHGGRYNLSANDRQFVRAYAKHRLSPTIIFRDKRKPLIEEMEKELPAAFKTNNIDTVYSLISAGADYLIKDEEDNFLKTADGRNLLHIAVEKNDSPLVSRLLSADFNLNEQDARCRTPLWYARKDKRLAQYLIDNGARTDRPTSAQRISWIIEQYRGKNIKKREGALFLHCGGNRQNRVTLFINKPDIFWELVYNPVSGKIEESIDRSSDPYIKYLDPYDFIILAENILEGTSPASE
jgi:ankyrin repeat protein